MNFSNRFLKTLVATAAASMVLAACATGMTKPDGAAQARDKLTALQSDSQLAARAPVEIKDAGDAVRAAEQPREENDETGRHLVFMADRKVDIAIAQAHARLLEDQRKGLSEQRESARLDSRTREADHARADANVARSDAERAETDANRARSQADAARMDTEAARMDTDAAKAKAADLQKQIAELNAKETNRGLVVTLGDLLFATGHSDLKGGVVSNLGRLAAFLNKYPDRTVTIEGYTDNVGSADSNMGLSQRRADAVKSYLISQGIASSRLSAAGMGEGSPVSDNRSATGRQQNRRVEVIIANTVTSSK